ncbi:MAG: bifunctional lysylphosphatidylglycerol synthetase/lysine--tRNA ligase LysX [Nocardiaceae bacterium]|nr:bifunctional lysylphosphatidylglycerol synthetase/lysine--tRNA ligase LysX [Nocardiaceae bacterium]
MRPWQHVRGGLSEFPHIAGSFIGVLAILCGFWSISPTLRHVTRGIRAYVDTYYFDAPDTSLAWAVVLALVAGAVASRKRIAWWFLGAYVLGYAVHNAYWAYTKGDVSAGVALAVQVVVLALLAASRNAFYTRVRPGAPWKAVGALAAGLTVGSLLGWGLVELFPGTLPGDERLLYSLNRVTAVFVAGNAEFSGHPRSIINFTLGLFGAMALLGAALILFRSQRSRNALTTEDEQAIRALIERSDVADSLAYFATRRDKAVVFAPSGKACVTYRVEMGVIIASGDPIGIREAWPHAIEAWLEVAAKYGWAPGVMGASEIGARAYQRAGLSILQLGDEAILHPDRFTLKGPEMKPVRQAANRLLRQGFSVRIRRHRELAEDEMAEVMERADRWRDTEVERGFSMALGRLGDPLDGDCLLVEALDAQGTPLGMLSLVPWGNNGASLDLMRRDKSGPNGVMELMVSHLVLDAGRHGISRISLNFAVMRTVFEEGGRIGAGPILRTWRTVLIFFSRWWQLEAMYRSNTKYQPEWVPRYIAFDDRRQLLKVGIAGAIAEGFIPRIGPVDASAHTGVAASVPELVAEILSQQATPKVSRRPEQVQVRIDKVARMAAENIEAYPVADTTVRMDSIAHTLAAPIGTDVRIAGRVLRLRDHGGVCFALLRDWSGDVQVILERDRLDADDLARFMASVDLGDLLEVAGVTTTSRSGEKSVDARAWRMNGKSLHPMPDKWRGFVDPEARVRARYLDLAINPEVRSTLIARSAVVSALRDGFREWKYLEVETPILQPIHGGAAARPFVTHINAYDVDLYLRIAPELYLKRLMVGGVEKVFEIGRTFRNEGADSSHNPEFTLLEAYEAYTDYRGMLSRCQDLIVRAAVAVHGTPVVLRPNADGELAAVDISGDWPVVSFYDAVSEAAGEPLGVTSTLSEMRAAADRSGVPYLANWTAAQIALEIYERLVEARTEAPTFYIDFPAEISPLTRPHRSIAGLAERWDLVAWGVELGTAYSELTDPIEQRRTLTEQSLLAAGGDADAMELDEDFLRGLEHAMPPTGGLGLGVDRIVMLVTGKSIRDTLAFPLVKPSVRG